MKPSSDARPDIQSLISREQVEKVLSEAMSRGGDFADVFVQRRNSRSIPLEERKIRSAEVRISQGVGIRVLSGEKTGYAYSDSLDPKSLMEAAKVAARIADGPDVDVPVRVASSAAPDYSPTLTPAQSRPVKEMTALVKRACKAAYDYDPHVKQVSVSWVDIDEDVIVANSDGLWIADHETLLRIYVQSMATKGAISQMGSFGGGGRMGIEFFDTLSPEDIAKESARMAVIQLDAVPAPAGMMPVVIKNGWGGVLFHESVGHGLEADFIRKQTSLFAGRMGEKVASDLCTVVDDATIPNCRGSYNIDDEGTPGQRKVLIEKGVLKGFLTDRLNGGLLGMPLTGNGRRQNYHDYPIPRMSNFFVAAGESDPEEIIKSVDYGVYAGYFSGGQVDITNGNFTFSVTEGYLIEKGKLTAPIRGATLIGNGPDVMQKIVMVGTDLELDKGIGTCGKDGQGVPTGVGMPTVKIAEMTVGGTGG